MPRNASELESIGEDKAGKAGTYKLETYAIPILGHMPITTIQRDHVAEVLLPIWTTKTRTDKDVRKLIEDVLNRAFATKNINRNNPARWDKLLRQRLPGETKKGANFPTLPFTLTNTDDAIFPTATGKHQRDARLSKVAREIGGAMGYQATVHGFRATFRTWGEEKTEYPEPAPEMASF
jgi:hypothetical protein